MRWLLALLAGLAFGQQERAVESIIPALAYGPACSSTVEVRNLGARAVTVELEGHRGSGALAAWKGRASATVRLPAGERASYQLDIGEETIGAWVKVRERVPARLSPAIAVSATTECVAANQLRTVRRDVAFPTRNPWFSSEAAESHGGVISLINTTEVPARASVCYSAGGLFSVGGRDLRPVCSVSFEVQVPPFGSREFPVEREGSAHFSLKTAGEAIVLEMLRPVASEVRVYEVDSTIRFGDEVKR